MYGQTYTLMESSAGYVERGIASWYGTKFHGQYTSSREPYDMYSFTAAHKTLPIPCYAQVTNLRNGRTLIVRVNDRGPFVDNRLIDLSYAAADRLGILGTGTGLVEVRVIDPRATSAAPAQIATDNGATPVTTAPNLYLQVGAFQSRINAERLREQLLRKASVVVDIVKATLNDGALYRVRLGPMENVEQADSLNTLIHQLGLGEPHVVIN
ncbi:MAG: septal ring lytic transglycosylase RlpA family protein [Gammaproteobacteria bacterium]|nr:septal ring lytic transglycosylase RlpA family protein [Gammaproteobacteria bacterium]